MSGYSGDSADGVAPIVSGDVQRALAALAGFNGSAWDRVRVPVVFKTLNAVAVAAEVAIWTPAAGKKFRFMGFLFAQGVASGAVVLKDGAGGATIFIVPQHTLGVALASPQLGNGILSAAVNNALTATGVATETLTGVVFGTEE